MSTSTVIVTPSLLLREGIASLLQSTRYKVVASVARPAELLTLPGPTGQQALAIFGVDLQNGALDEVAEGVRLLRSSLTDVKVVLVAESDQGIDPLRVLAMPPDACILNLKSRDALIKVVELVFLNERVILFPKSIAKTTNEQGVEFTEPARGLQPDPCSVARSDPYRLGINGHRLSPREAEILTSLALGNSNKVIARLHHLSEATVKVHLKAILRKTNVHNRTQAAIWAIEHGYRDHLSLENTPSISDARKSQAVNGARPL
jgi:two-component system, NarL family, nitrate/nitrite response regulator NarL